jgi:hypothetical protein
MSTHLGPRGGQAPQAIIPVRPAGPETARVSTVGLLRRTLAFHVPSRRTLGGRLPSRHSGGGIHMSTLIAKVRRPTSDNDAAGSVSAAPTRLGRTAQIARVVAVPMVAVAALAGAAGSARAATNSVGDIEATVYCVSDTYNHTAQIAVYPHARENSQFATQYVAYRYYYAAQGSVPSGWSRPTLVDAVKVTTDAYGNPITLTGWTDLPPTSWSVHPGGGRIAYMYVQGAFWNGTAYEYSQWIPATYYTVVDGYSTGQDGNSPVPCSV